MIIDKTCDNCNCSMKKVNHQTKYCEKCRELINKQSAKKYKSRTRKEDAIKKDISLRENFDKVAKEPYHLTPKGFNVVSEINYNTYQNFYKKTWLEIIKEFNRYDVLYAYIVTEYQDYVAKTNKMDIRSFTDSHPYIGGQILRRIGTENIKKSSGVDYYRNTIDDCKNEFKRLCAVYGRVPHYSEFISDSKITLKSFKFHLNISGKNAYDNIVKAIADDHMYKSYIHNKRLHKENVGRENHQGYKYTEKELEINFKKVFDDHYERYGSHPSEHLFDKVSNISFSTYSKRLDKSWANVCDLYGYKTRKRLNKSEMIALGVVSEILNEEYEPQKTFKWLIGFKGFPLFCDGYFPSKNLIVEFDGDQHRYPTEWFGGMKTFHETRTNDLYKNVLAERNGVKLIRITSEEPFWDKNYISKKLIKYGINLHPNT